MNFHSPDQSVSEETLFVKVKSEHNESESLELDHMDTNGRMHIGRPTAIFIKEENNFEAEKEAEELTNCEKYESTAVEDNTNGFIEGNYSELIEVKTGLKENTVSDFIQPELEVPRNIIWDDETGGPFKCALCDITLETRSALCVHLREHTGKLMCVICKKDFPRKYHLLRHMARHYRRRPFACAHCQKAFKEKDSYNQHLKRQCHLEKGSAEFKNDGKTDSLAVEDNDNRDLEENNPEVVEGEEKGNQPENNPELVGSEEKGNQPKAMCFEDIVSDFFEPELKGADNIIWDDESGGPFKCSLCDKTFNLRSDLSVHQREHTGKMMCIICNRDFAKKYRLVRHLFRHYRRRSFVCEYCGKAFKETDCYNRHLKRHLPPKTTTILQEMVECNEEGLVEEEPDPEPVVTADVPANINDEAENVLEVDILDHPQDEEGANSIIWDDKTGGPFKCTLCEELFSLRSELCVHLHVHTGKLMCVICKKYFNRKYHLLRHLARHYIRRPFSCQRCRKAFKEKETYSRHIKGCICPQRRETVVAECLDTEDVQNSSAIIVKKEESCELKAEVADRSKPEYHMPTGLYENGKPACKGKFKCPICGKSFVKKYSLKRHMNTHVFERLYTCEECGKSYNDRSYFITHVQKHVKSKHDKAETEYKCKVCAKICKGKTGLKAHVRLHGGGYKCPVCGKCFAKTYSLKRHMIFHGAQQLGSSGKDENTLSSHVDSSSTKCSDVPDNEESTKSLKESYSCDSCHKVFQTKTEFTGHGCESTFSCTECDKLFQSREALRFHLRIHAGKLECSICNKCFGKKLELERHLNIHVVDHPFLCLECGKAFKDMKSLKYHKTYTHEAV